MSSSEIVPVLKPLKVNQRSHYSLNLVLLQQRVIASCMFKREKDILQEIAGELSADTRILKAVVYGSRVRGDFRGDSDLDALIIVDKKSRELKAKIVDIFYTYELATDISFSLTIRSQEELKFNEKLGSSFFESIKKEGIIFYDSGQRREEDALKVST